MSVLQLFPNGSLYIKEFRGPTGDIIGEVSNLMAFVRRAEGLSQIPVYTVQNPDNDRGVEVDGVVGNLKEVCNGYVDIFTVTAEKKVVVTRIYKPKKIIFSNLPEKVADKRFIVGATAADSGIVMGDLDSIQWTPMYVATLVKSGIQSLVLSGIVKNRGSPLDATRAVFNTKSLLQRDRSPSRRMAAYTSSQSARSVNEVEDGENWTFSLNDFRSTEEASYPLYSVPLKNAETRFFLPVENGASVTYGYQITTDRPLPQAPVRVVSDGLLVGTSTLEIEGPTITLKVAKSQNILAVVQVASASNSAKAEVPVEIKEFDISFTSRYNEEIFVNLEMRSYGIIESANPSIKYTKPGLIGWIITVAPGKSKITGRVIFRI